MKLARNSIAATGRETTARARRRLGVVPALTDQTAREDSSAGYAPSPLDFLCHPGVPGGDEKEIVREERRQEDPSITGGKQRDVGGTEETDDTYWMTAGADDADRTQGSFQALGREGRQATD